VEGPNSASFYMMAMWAVLAMALFFLRPQSMRRSDQALEGGEKPTALNNNNNQPPPPPPAH